MKVNIYNLTKTTITFSKIGLVLRGLPDDFNQQTFSSNADRKAAMKDAPYNYGMMNAIARNVVLDSNEKIGELKGMERLGYVRVEEIVQAHEVEEEQISFDKIVEDEHTSRSTKDRFDEGRAIPNKNETVRKEQKEARDRRAQAKNREEQRKREQKEAIKKAQEKKRTRAIDLQVPTGNETKAVVMTDSGAVETKTKNKFSGEIEDDDPRCRRSLEAAEKLENGEDAVVNEEILETDQMGSEVVIGSGGSSVHVKNMKSDATTPSNDAEASFLEILESLDNDPQEKESKSAFIEEEEKVDLEIENAFIDNEENTDDEIPFIEY